MVENSKYCKTSIKLGPSLLLYLSPRCGAKCHGDGVLSVQYRYICLYVCMYVCMYVTTVLHENWTEWTEIWYTNYVGCRDLQPLQAFAVIQIVVVGSENVKGGQKFT